MWVFARSIDVYAKPQASGVSQEAHEEAIRAYEEVETAIRRFLGAETVLVQVGSVEALRRAYPNYFADTTVFVAEVKKAIEENVRP